MNNAKINIDFKKRSLLSFITGFDKIGYAELV